MKGFLKYRIFHLALLSCLLGWGQEAVHNYGSIKIHDTGLVGFHMNVINDGAFNQNMGLVGFYSQDSELVLSGSSNPVFFDLEVAVEKGLYLENTMGILNNLNLISGNVHTPRVQSEVNISFLNESFYVGEDNLNHIEGYASIQGKDSFTFPIGNGDKLRPLTLTSNAINDYAKSAYYYENPNSPSVFGESFNTENLQTEFLSVSNFEFWHLEGEKASKVELTWNENSNIGILVDDISELKVVGWSVQNKIWEDLGNTDFSGNLSQGNITSDIFVPNGYKIITLGGNKGLLQSLSSIDLDNYYMTPNGDGVNDRLVINGIENSPDNSIQIFNRYGVLVYSKSNYNNEFEGISNRETAIARNSGLASGIYFYIISLNDLNEKHQGYLYLTTYQ